MDHRYEPPGERAIREALERGDFDDLPGAGKPLRDLGDLNDPDWWLKGFVAREQIDVAGVLPPTLALRREAEAFPGSLLEFGTEAAVRDVLDDFNRRVKVDRLRPVTGRFPVPIARTVDVEEMVEQWRRLKAAERASHGGHDRSHPTLARKERRPRGRLGRLGHAFAVWSGMADPD